MKRSSILNFNAINLREAHERPEANEKCVTIMTGTNTKNIVNAIKYFENQSSNKSKTNNLVNSYSNKNVSDIITRIVISYINFIKQNNYKKNIT